MRRLVVSEYVSLDGVVEQPSWTAPYWNDEIARFKFDELFASDALLLGRVTYEGFAAAWPAMQDEQGFADRMNSLPKYVVSATLAEAAWNNSHIIREDLAAEVTRLKQGPGMDILVYGSGELVHALLQHGLVDELRCLVYPLVLGSGKPLFKPAAGPLKLELVEANSFSSGVVLLAYRPGPG
jgi:dihydrofolate reductase